MMDLLSLSWQIGAMISKTGTQKNGEAQNGRVWFESKGDLIWLGLTSLGVESVGELESVDLPNEGASFAEGDVLAEVQGDAGSIEILAPFALEVFEVNEAAGGNLEQISEDPLEEGWLVKIRDKANA